MGETRITAEPNSPLISISREFDAPPELVLRAHTDPELMKRWLGPRRYQMHIDHFDVRHGGSYRYRHTDADGNEYAFRGVFHGDPSLEGFTQTFEFEGYPGHISLDTARFVAAGGGRTLLQVESVFQSVADRDGMIASGMEGGMNEGYDRLDELLSSLSVTAA
jgi:uncharacterized protein YndB with AHSA1/START domain